MALHIEDPDIVRRVLELRGISVEELLRRALDAEEARAQTKYDKVMKYMEEEVWPHISPNQLGKRLTKEEEEALLGYGLGEY